jgi:uncharacterized repeat protein (TIGR03803 family)
MTAIALPAQTFTTLHSFNGTDGNYLRARLVQAANGRLYGTTTGGGACPIPGGCGTVFKITPSGALTTLYSFCPEGDYHCTDGLFPETGLVQAANGAFYGTTHNGGNYGGGTVFKITPGGTLTIQYRFHGEDGYKPTAGLVQATDGNFYGTTFEGGAGACYDGCGTVFKITPSGTLTTLHNFDRTDGANPVAGLVQDTDGNFYGTTESGGANGNYGTVFSLSVGLSPFVETLPASGKVGAAVNILGTNLIGATSVTFNGTAATFTVVSSSEITTTVPSGATTGTVQVVTPGGTLSSNIPFTVN